MFSRSGAKRDATAMADLVDAKEAARKSRLQLAKARARRAFVDEEIRRQYEIREEDGFAAIIEDIFVTRREE